MSKRRRSTTGPGKESPSPSPGEPGGGPANWKAGVHTLASEENEVDRAGRDSFPASDPPSWTPRVSLGPPRHEPVPAQPGQTPSIERPLSGDVLAFDLEHEQEAARDAAILARSGRTARTLVKDSSLRVSVHLLAPGGEIREHHADGPITVQVLRGSVLLHARGRDVQLSQGQLMALDTGVAHSLRSPEGAAFLLTVSLADAKRQD